MGSCRFLGPSARDEDERRWLKSKESNGKSTQKNGGLFRFDPLAPKWIGVLSILFETIPPLPAGQQEGINLVAIVASTVGKHSWMDRNSDQVMERDRQHVP